VTDSEACEVLISMVESLIRRRNTSLFPHEVHAIDTLVASSSSSEEVRHKILNSRTEYVKMYIEELTTKKAPLVVATSESEHSEAT